jgi:hypothetical protein
MVLAIEANTLINLATEAWNRAVADAYYPPLPDVHIEYNPANHDYFYITPDTWQVNLNLAGISSNMSLENIEPYIRGICHHEIQHYITCPYDGVTSGFMFAAARRHLRDDIAMFVSNIFADLVVDGHLLGRFPSLTRDRINWSIEQAAEKADANAWLWRLCVSCYNVMYEIPLPDWVMDKQMLRLANDIAKIVNKHKSTIHTWHKAVEKIAKLLAKEFDEEDKQDQMPAGGIPAEGMNGDQSQMRNSDDAKRIMKKDNLDYNQEEELERMLSEAQKRGAKIDEIEAICILAGADDGKRTWVKIWYRVTARAKMKVEITVPRRTGSLPYSPNRWRLGEPIEDLDIVASLQAFPVIVPNVSTIGWEKREYGGSHASEQIPDLLIVIDSSGSMGWHVLTGGKKNITGRYHTALVGAFSAMELAIKKRARVAVINFSNTTKSCDWTRNRREAEDVLMRYQGGGTNFPCKKVEDMCRDHRNPILVLFVTDAEVTNAVAMLDMIRNVDRQGHKVVIFRIGSGAEKKMKRMADAGASVYSTKSAKDLDGLIIQEAKGVYIKEQ